MFFYSTADGWVVLIAIFCILSPIINLICAGVAISECNNNLDADKILNKTKGLSASSPILKAVGLEGAFICYGFNIICTLILIFASLAYILGDVFVSKKDQYFEIANVFQWVVFALIVIVLFCNLVSLYKINSVESNLRKFYVNNGKFDLAEEDKKDIPGMKKYCNNVSMFTISMVIVSALIVLIRHWSDIFSIGNTSKSTDSTASSR